MMIADAHWNVPYRFKGATIIRDRQSWTGGERLADFFKQNCYHFDWVNDKHRYSVVHFDDEIRADRVQFEKDCRHIPSTITDFLAWTNHTLSPDHPLNEYSNDEYFAYADYMHLPELLENDEHPLINMIDWSDMGLKNRSGKESTVWIGSEGAHTPCHYDTYGINFVAQIVGRKRWLLFPPNSPIGQLQTRIPYEESSVYIDIEPSLMEKYKDIDVYDVILEPGDVLFVPKHWWHFVTSLDPLTVSVNSWLEQPDDHMERIKEMLVRQILTSTMVSHDYPSDQWLNHNEVVTDPMTNLTILSSLVANSDSTETCEPPSKRSRNVITPASHIHEQPLVPSPFGLSSSNAHPSPNPPSDNELLLKRLVKAMTARDTIDLIYNKLFPI